MTQLVYLAGPINGISYRDCTSWREYVANKLPPHIQAVSPMRAKPELRRRRRMGGRYPAHLPLATDDGITTRDRFDVFRSDAILMNLLGAKIVTIGTMVELGWADALRKPVILVMERAGNVHDHPMVRHIAGFRAHTLEQGIELIVKIVSPD